MQILFFTEPRAGFEIAFKMFDVDENKTVDRTEFLVVIFVIIWLLKL